MVSTRRARGWTAALVAVLIAAALLVWLLRDRGGGDGAARTVTREDPEASAGAMAPPLRGSRRAPSAGAAGELAALAAALDEETIPIDSPVVIGAIDSDRRWVCAGETMRLTPEVGGEPVEGMLFRWVWLGPDGAGLEPGDTVMWRAPELAGGYELHFQVVKDLGGKQVGLLADRAIAVEVRQCAAGEGQEHEPLRLVATQRGHAQFSFWAAYQGDGEVESFAWDFGDGQTLESEQPTAAHSYDASELGPLDEKRFVARVEARLRGGEPLRASAVALVGGRPEAADPPHVDLEIERWRRDPDTGDWRTPLALTNPRRPPITWEMLERITLYFDDTHEIETIPWQQVVTVEADLGGGGFRGYVSVEASEVPPNVKQITDTLYGHDADGEPVVASWTPFKRSTPPGGAPEPEPAPSKRGSR